jgi:hypothetical protein
VIRAALPLLACLLGCGRLDFGEVRADGAVAPDVPVGHDEDGDGIGDAVDPCPHVAGSKADTDSDGVGDACDPHPTTPGDQLVVFSSMEPGTIPFDELVITYTQEADALHLLSNGSIFLTRSFRSARIELGFEILEIIGTGQHQIGAGVQRGSDPYYFAELNDNLGATLHNVQIVSYDPSNGYVSLGSVDSPPLHTGVGIMRIDVDANANTYATVAGWEGELFTAMASTPLYTGGPRLHYSFNGLDVLLRYLVIIDAP